MPTRAAFSGRPHRFFLPKFFLLLFNVAFLACLFATAEQSFAQTAGKRPVAFRIEAYAQPESSTGAASAHGASALAPIVPTSAEQRVFDLVNAERERNNLPPLLWDDEVCRMARLHSEKMAALDFFDHEGPDGDLPTRASGIRWKSLGENIALNQNEADPGTQAVAQWMNSAGHRTNILRAVFTHSAIGIARSKDGRIYLTQVFIMR